MKEERSAFIVFRQSGGLRFRIREVEVYRDGRVTWRREGTFDAAQGERQLTPEEVVDLQAAIERSGLFGLPTSIGRQALDGYAYELVARAGRKSTSIELFDGSVPLELRPLIERLKKLISDPKA